MATTAQCSTGWRVRLGIIAVMSVFMTAFFLYDGFIGYPDSQKLYEKFKAFQESHEDLGEAELLKQWNAHAAQNQLPVENKVKKLLDLEKTDSDIRTQRILGFILVPLSFMVCLSFMRWLKQTVTCDDSGVSNSKGQTASWESMVKLDKTRWPKKGIAYLHFKEGDVEQRMLIDDFKYERDPTEQIVRAIEAKLEDAQIVGDIRETERDKRRAEKKAAEAGEASKAGKDDDASDSESATDGDDGPQEDTKSETVNADS